MYGSRSDGLQVIDDASVVSMFIDDLEREIRYKRAGNKKSETDGETEEEEHFIYQVVEKIAT